MVGNPISTLNALNSGLLITVAKYCQTANEYLKMGCLKNVGENIADSTLQLCL